MIFKSIFAAKEDENGIRYAGFNVRLLANLIDMMLLMVVLMPFFVFAPPQANIEDHPVEIQQAIYEKQNAMISDQQFWAKVVPYLLEDMLPKMIPIAIAEFIIFGLVFVLFWKYKNSTPGKMFLKLRIVDAKTMEDPSLRQYIMRFIGYFIASIPLGLGFLTIPFNKRKRGMHDLMAGTIVIFAAPRDIEKEQRNFKYQTYFFLSVILIFAIYMALR